MHTLPFWTFWILDSRRYICDALLDLVSRIQFSPLSANPTKWSNILKQFVVKNRQIVWVCLTILWGCRLKVKSTLKNREEHPWGSVTFIKVAGFRIFREAKASHITIILSKLLWSEWYHVHKPALFYRTAYFYKFLGLQIIFRATW